MKVTNIWAKKCQLGWATEITFLVTTAAQFSDEECYEIEIRKTLIGSFISAYWEALKTYREKRAKPGERRAKGWS